MWLKPKFIFDVLTPDLSLRLEKGEKQNGLFHKNPLDSPKSYQSSNPYVR